MPYGNQPGMVQHTDHFLIMHGKSLEPFPAREIKKSLFFGILGNNYRWIFSNHVEWLKCFTAIFPSHQHIPSTPLTARIIRLQGTLMCIDIFELKNLTCLLFYHFLVEIVNKICISINFIWTLLFTLTRNWITLGWSSKSLSWSISWQKMAQKCSRSSLGGSKTDLPRRSSGDIVGILVAPPWDGSLLDGLEMEWLEVPSNHYHQGRENGGYAHQVQARTEWTALQ